MSQFRPDPKRYTKQQIDTYLKEEKRRQAEKNDLDSIAMTLGSARVEDAYKAHLKQNYHMLNDQYQTCVQITNGQQNELGFLDPNFVEYCKKKQRKLLFKKRVWENAHPSCCEM